MARRAREVDVSDLDDVDLLERALARRDLGDYERDAFAHMLEDLRWRQDEYGDDAYPLTERQREWVERAARRPKRWMTGEEFLQFVSETIGRDPRL